MAHLLLICWTWGSKPSAHHQVRLSNNYNSCKCLIQTKLVTSQLAIRWTNLTTRAIWQHALKPTLIKSDRSEWEDGESTFVSWKLETLLVSETKYKSFLSKEVRKFMVFNVIRKLLNYFSISFQHDSETVVDELKRFLPSAVSHFWPEGQSIGSCMKSRSWITALKRNA